MYKIALKKYEDGDDWGCDRTILTIETEDGVTEYYDCGEPEDNTFGRDWNWVPTELERAYKKGLADAAKQAPPEAKEDD